MRKIKTYSKLNKEMGFTFIEKEFDETLKSHEV